MLLAQSGHFGSHYLVWFGFFFLSFRRLCFFCRFFLYWLVYHNVARKRVRNLTPTHRHKHKKKQHQIYVLLRVSITTIARFNVSRMQYRSNHFALFTLFYVYTYIVVYIILFLMECSLLLKVSMCLWVSVYVYVCVCV